MTDILIHNVCFGKNTLRVTVDQTMDYNKSIPDDSVHVKSDIDNDTYNEESQDEVTEKMERINDEIENKPDKNFGNGVTEKSLDLTNIKHDVSKLMLNDILACNFRIHFPSIQRMPLISIFALCRLQGSFNV